MHNGYNRVEEQDVGRVEELIRLPSKNLESRIAELEAAISERQGISWEALSVLGTEKLRLEDRLDRLRHAGLAEGVSQAEANMKRSQVNLGQIVIGEQVSYFNDIQRLKYQLRKAKEGLATERQKLQMVRDIPDTMEPD